MMGNIILEVIIFIAVILNIILFFKIWGMTNDVEKLKNNVFYDVGRDVEKLKLKICNRGLTNDQLSKRVLELKYTGQIDEAKKLVDENLILDVFDVICSNEGTIEQSKEKVWKVTSWYEKYYKCLNCEMPKEIREINVGKVVADYSLL